jgi:hypothetical protein
MQDNLTKNYEDIKLNTYEIIYTTTAHGSTQIRARSQREAIEAFDKLASKVLFEEKDLLRGIEIEDINRVW